MFFAKTCTKYHTATTKTDLWKNSHNINISSSVLTPTPTPTPTNPNLYRPYPTPTPKRVAPPLLSWRQHPLWHFDPLQRRGKRQLGSCAPSTSCSTPKAKRWILCRLPGIPKKMYMDVEPKIGGEKKPKWMVKIMENPIRMDDLGGFPPFFLKHPYNNW